MREEDKVRRISNVRDRKETKDSDSDSIDEEKERD